MTGRLTGRDELEISLAAIRESPDAPEAWAAFYRAVTPSIRGYLYLLGARDLDAIADLTQDALLRFLRYCPWRQDWASIAAAPFVRGYVRQVVRSTFLDQRKRDMARRAAELGADADAVEGHAPTDFSVAFRHLASSLNEEERELLMMLAEGSSLPDIAQIFDISYSAAGARVSRLKQKLEKSARASRPHE